MLVAAILALAGCAGEPRRASPLQTDPALGPDAVPGAAASRSPRRPDGTITCPDGRPILSGWITTADVVPPNIHFSQMPALGAGPDEWIDGHSADVDTILVLGHRLNALIADSKDLLYAARSGNYCGGPP